MEIDYLPPPLLSPPLNPHRSSSESQELRNRLNGSIDPSGTKARRYSELGSPTEEWVVGNGNSDQEEEEKETEEKAKHEEKKRVFEQRSLRALSSGRSGSASALLPSSLPAFPTSSDHISTAVPTVPISPSLPSLSLWDYLKVELTSSTETMDSEERSENLMNVLKVPIRLEMVILFGVLACLDSFLYMFTIMPLRLIGALYAIILHITSIFMGQTRGRVAKSHKSVILKGIIVCFVFWSLQALDTSKIYHNIRGQAAIKLYVMFNVFEVADKLCSAIGQDILECLFAPQTLDISIRDGSKAFRPVLFLMLSIGYTYIHSMVLLYQVITLNVAVNSYSNALLTLLLSNQFSELKSTVFKKFERENLFQLTCADITERFQLIIMISLVGLRNIVEVSSTGIIPSSWSGWNRWLGAIFGPTLVVVGSEVCVDWIKHSYISKFNNLRPRIYRKFLDVLTWDYAENCFSDQIMTKRIGLPVFPLACVFARMSLQSYQILLENQAAVATPSSQTMQANSTATQIATTSNPSALEKVDLFFSKIPISRSSLSNVVSTINVILIIISCFMVLLAFKLVLGLFLLKYSSKRRANGSRPRFSRSRRRSFKGTQIKGSRSSTGPPESDYLPGSNRGLHGVVEVTDSIRSRLYDPDEEIPSKKDRKEDINELRTVTRFKMITKQIW